MKTPKKPARLWAVWSPTKGYRCAVRSSTIAKNTIRMMVGMVQVPEKHDYVVVPVRLVKITPRRGRRSK